MLQTLLPSLVISHQRSTFRPGFASLLVSAATALGLLAASPDAFANGNTRSSLQEASTGTWQKLTNQPSFQTDTALLLTDGTVMTHQYNSPNWWRLTPDNTGSYLNGTWSQLASMASNYAPLYFASAVLADGRVIVEGGEYNFLQLVESNLGSIYDPVANAWTPVLAPTGWTTIGDSPCAVLPNGTFTMGRNASKQQVFFNAATLTWTTVGTGKA